MHGDLPTRPEFTLRPAGSLGSLLDNKSLLMIYPYLCSYTVPYADPRHPSPDLKPSSSSSSSFSSRFSLFFAIIDDPHETNYDMLVEHGENAPKETETLRENAQAARILKHLTLVDME